MPSVAERVVPLRHPWTWVASALALIVAGRVLVSVATNPAFEWPVVAHYMLDEQILAGLARTLELTVAAMAMGLLLGTVLAVMRLSRNAAAVDAELGLHLVLPQRACSGAADLLVQFRRAVSARSCCGSRSGRFSTAPAPTR